MKKKKEIEGRPTKDLEIDESQLMDEEKSHYESPLKSFLIVGGILLVLIIVCIVIIYVSGGPITND